MRHQDLVHVPASSEGWVQYLARGSTISSGDHGSLHLHREPAAGQQPRWLWASLCARAVSPNCLFHHRATNLPRGCPTGTAMPQASAHALTWSTIFPILPHLLRCLESRTAPWCVFIQHPTCWKTLAFNEKHTLQKQQGLITKSSRSSLNRSHRSQNVQGWKGPLGITQPNPLPKQRHPEQAAQHCVQAGLEYLQRRRLHRYQQTKN